MKHVALVAAAAAGLAFAPAPDETTFHVGHHEKFVNITFESQADIETIVGTTNKAKGTVKADLDKGIGSVSITVPVASMKTGIDLRDEHLRSEHWLNAQKFPEITFTSKKVEPVKNSKSRVKVTGDFTMSPSGSFTCVSSRPMVTMLDGVNTRRGRATMRSMPLLMSSLRTPSRSPCG